MWPLRSAARESSYASCASCCLLSAAPCRVSNELRDLAAFVAASCGLRQGEQRIGRHHLARIEQGAVLEVLDDPRLQGHTEYVARRDRSIPTINAALAYFRDAADREEHAPFDVGQCRSTVADTETETARLV